MEFRQTPFRFTPNMPPGAYVTYQIDAPRQTHTRPATCAEVDCFHAKAGWRTIVDVATEKGATQANYIRLMSGRHFTHTQLGTIVTFHFPGGQKCFADHRVPLDRPEIYTRIPGDWRGRTGEAYRYTGRQASVNWVDDFANNQLIIADRVQRG
jgi:hypothetical protein